MTWAERVGDVATNLALVAINLARIFTLLIRIATERVDAFITGLAERSESGIQPTETRGNVWVRLPAAVSWGVAAVALRTLSVLTVFARQAAVTVDEFFRILAEGETPGGQAAA